MDDAGVADLNSSNNKDKDILDVQVHMVDAGVGIEEENAGQVVELHHHGGGGGADQNRRIPGPAGHKCATIFHDKDHFYTVHWAKKFVDRPDGGPEGPADQDPGRVGQVKGETQGARKGMQWTGSKTDEKDKKAKGYLANENFARILERPGELCEAATGEAEVGGAPPGQLQDGGANAQVLRVDVKQLSMVVMAVREWMGMEEQLPFPIPCN